MDRRHIEERQIAERYLQGKLRDEEERAFEEAYLGDPELLDDLILTEKLRHGLRLDGDSRAGPSRRTGVAGSLFASPRYAAAATVLLALSAALSGTLYVQNRDLRDAAGQGSGASVTRLLPLVTVRGDGANEIGRPAADEWIVFLVDAGFTEYDEYRATVFRLASDAEERVRQLDGLAPTYDGMLPVGLPGEALSPGEYRIVAEGRMSDWPSERGFEQIARTTLRIAE
ncbi:MAG: hypothetical protein JXB36_18765 [Gammaproteobacteria bacterium]|nr:hypothetical protein [Gammaproteobacteria bacterium]